MSTVELCRKDRGFESLGLVALGIFLGFSVCEFTLQASVKFRVSDPYTWT